MFKYIHKLGYNVNILSLRRGYEAKFQAYKVKKNYKKLAFEDSTQGIYLVLLSLHFSVLKSVRVWLDLVLFIPSLLKKV